MQKYYPKKRTFNKLKASLLLLMMVCFAGAAQAQTRANEIRMKTGTESISDNVVYNFYDSGGPNVMDPSLDPNNDYNWVSWYQHNESYLLHFTNPLASSGKGIKVVFNYLLINNDHLKIYEGDLENEANLIADLTCTDYSTNNYAGFAVVSHGNMTIRFESDYHWRDAGWEALVELYTYAPQPPVANMQACASYVELLNGSKGTTDTKVLYTLGGNDPAFGDPLGDEIYEYTGPFELTQAPTTVKTITVENATSTPSSSSIASYTFTRLITPPAAPTITHVANTNTVIITAPAVPSDINDTYYVRYSIDGTDPRYSSLERAKADTIELTQPCTVRAVTRGTTCPDIFSETEDTETISTIYLPTPVISVTGTYNQTTNPDGLGNGTITCSLPGATIYYTLDGTTPTTASPLSGTGTINLSDVPAGTTIKAIAHIDNTSYVDSPVATFVYIPTGANNEPQNGVFGSVVLLDDREDHSWSYYSDGDQPVHSLKPANVKITYFGYGEGTMTTTDTGDEPTVFAGDVDAEDVAVGPNTPGNQFIYMKTLENASTEGSGNYPYTLIPNPFSKRPTYSNSTITTRQVYLNWSCNNWTYNGNQATATYEYTGADNQVHVVQNTSNGNITINVKIGTTITLRAKASRNRDGYRPTITARLDNSSGTQIGTLTANNTTEISTTTSPVTSSENNYRGFYAWRVKRLSSGLKINVNGTEYNSTSTNIPPIMAETEVEFVAEPYSTDNEVVFEALWAQAYVVTSNTATGLHSGVSYERNFVVGAAPGTTELSVPVTYSSYYPDGTQATNNQMDLGDFTLLADTKFEYMRLNGSGTTTANGHSLCFGRGITGGNNVQGISGNYNGDLSYTMRVESGTFGTLAYVAEINCTVSGRVQVKAIMGCDYDRATKTNSLLSVSNSANLFFTRDVAFSNESNKDKKVFDLVVKSGEYQKNYWTNTGDQTNFTYTHSMYCGANFGSSSNNAHYPGVRYVTIEGGALGNVNGGRGTRVDGNNNNPGATTPGTDAKKVSFSLRIKKDAVINGCVFGGAANTSAWGSKRLVVTGGEVLSWIAGGANGTNTTNGDSRTRGAAYIYVGGNAKVGGPNAIRRNGTYGGQVFGAGRGNENQAASMDSSYVVIADNAQILRKESEASGNVYGGGNIGYIAHKSNVYILGGTVGGSVFGGAYGNEFDIPTSNVYVEGGKVNGSVYGGSNNSGTVVNSHVTMTGGEATDVFGGGLGTSTNIGENTVVAYSGGIINNVYGGGALGTVSGNTDVTVSGGTVNNVFGAGMGSNNSTANIGGTTTVNVSGGTIAESVYGGGQNGNVKQANNPYNSKGRTTEGNRDINPVSTVNITGGNIANNVFGGGSMGFTNGGTVVNMSGGSVEGSVFGGAFGTQSKVYVAGLRTVNMRGGTVNRHVYGGSRNADDALTFIDDDENGTIFDNDTTTATASVVNMSGGYVHYQVFASGYFGNVFGSTYAFIGTNAILNAPNHVYTADTANINYFNAHQALRIGGSVWAGGDFGNYDGSKFGAPTVSGRSNIYIDGTGYDTESNSTTNTNYMYIGGSIYGSGTSCDAGKQGRHIILREYGQAIQASQPTAALPYSSATRALYSIQRADSLVIDNAHVVLLGEGKINSLVTTEKYTIHEFKLVRLANGCSIFLNYPADQIMKFGSYTCPSVYDNNGAVKYTKVSHDGLGAQGGSSDNKIRVNDGAYVNVYHDELKYTVNGQTQTGGFGELEGFAHMMTDNTNTTCAYARPKQSTDEGNIIPNAYDNEDDGGFISYEAAQNTFNLDGGTVTGGNSIQMPYENHTTGLRNGEQYFRIWRAGGKFSYREGVFVAQGSNVDGYSTAQVTISLPAFENCSEGTGYYQIKSLDGNTLIDYGTDVETVNAACYGDTDVNDWMYFNDTVFVTEQSQSDLRDLHYIAENPNVTFGLVAIPENGLGGEDNDPMIICEASDPEIAAMKWYNTNNEQMPKVTFLLTYNNNLTNNVVWDPIRITFEQVSCSGDTIASVDVALTVTTLTSIEQDFITQAYAVVRGTGSATDSYTAKIVLPQYVMHVNEIGEISKWTCKQVEWNANPDYNDTIGDVITNPYSGSFVGGTSYLNPTPSTCNNLFGMNLAAGLNFDNSTGWEVWESNPKEVYDWNNTSYVFGETTARDPIAFDFKLLYDGRQRAEGNYMLGTLKFTMHFTNYQAAGAEPFEKDLTIKIEVWFLGQGNNYYIDGVHGNNLYSGKYPNAAKKTLSGVFNRTDYHAGDFIFVVDTITANLNNKLMWNGKAYDEVTLYRYPGGHQCVQNIPHAESHYEDYDLESNACYLGPLVRVAKNMDMTGIILDGFYKESKKPEGGAAGDIQGYYHTYVPAIAPLVEILDGGKLSVYGSSRIENNYNSTNDGGGVYVNNGGVLNIYDGSAIDTNYVSNSKNGGGIYVNSTSTVQLSDEVYITGNCKGVPSAKANESVENNVYLSTYDSYVTVGSSDTDDPYTMLLADSRVGVTKNHEWGDYYYAPVAYSDGGQTYLTNLITENAPTTGAIMWDDETKYEILSLNNTHLNPPTDFVYFVGTWVTAVTSEPEDFDADDIDTPEELAWAISIASGYNGETAAPDSTFTLTGDIDMNANIWVPIGSNGYPYKGVFNGNGHVVTGLRSPLNQENMGMFGSTNGATISDLVARANFSGGSMKNLGTLIGQMSGGVLSNVEAAGTLTGTNSTANIGGLVGEALSGTIHSGFAVNTMTGGSSTVVGGLVGTNGANLYNSYANAEMSANNTATTLGGLVGVNQANCTVENCYVINPIGPAFAATNSGDINFCYAPKPVEGATVTYVGEGTQPTTHGTYDVVKGRKELGYLYDDNKVEKVGSGANTYITEKDSIYYDGAKILKWRGMVSTLNQWVKANPKNLSDLAPWFRPTTDTINGDLPVLGFPKDNSMGTLSSDGKFLRYGSNVNGTGVDDLLTNYNDNGEGDAEPKANIFFYGTAENVAEVPGNNVYVFINEDAVLLQAANAGNFTATVGVTFDNSDKGKHSFDYWHNKLDYDWHFMSSSLSDAPMGIGYGDATGQGGDVSISSMEGNYFPNGLPMALHGSTKWDLYTYYEPEYHWINLKRRGDDHWHTDNANKIQYLSGQEGLAVLNNETIFVPGKGYMMAISQDSYLSSTGTLNKQATIALTNAEPLNPEYNKGWNLVGNPFQAYLDLDLVANSVQGPFYVYDAEIGNYVAYAVGQSMNTATPSRYIHPHQAFFMKASSNTITFVPTMATATKLDDSYFRGDEQVNYPLVNLFVENERGNRDLAVIEFNRPEIGGATKVSFMNSATFSVAAHLEGGTYGLLFVPEGTERVPVYFGTEESGTFTITWDKQNGDFTSLLLVDNMTGTITDMLRADSYTFDATTDDYASRFYITYRVTAVDENVDGDGTFAFFDGSAWIVEGKGMLDVVDVMGRTLYSERLVNDKNRVSLNGVAAGVYLLRVSDGTNTMVQKIVVK